MAIEIAHGQIQQTITNNKQQTTNNNNKQQTNKLQTNK
jgi:hypothetical protein